MDIEEAKKTMEEAKKLRSDRCIDAIKGVLTEHNCSLDFDIRIRNGQSTVLVIPTPLAEAP